MVLVGVAVVLEVLDVTVILAVLLVVEAVVLAVLVVVAVLLARIEQEPHRKRTPSVHGSRKPQAPASQPAEKTAPFEKEPPPPSFY